MTEKKFLKPHIIDFNKLGAPEIGYISVNELEHNTPFDVKRIFWTYYTPQEIRRGHHAHFITEQLLIAVSGKIIVETDCKGEKNEFVLDNPSKGLYLPPDCWHVMQYEHSSVQLALASTEYEESDYIRDYNKFKEIYK
jgi:hypothetical protein